MARKLQIKRGLKAQLPALAPGELALTTDEGKVYIGNDGNIELARSDAPPNTHKHAASDTTSGTFPIVRGGTGGSTAAAARVNLDTSKPVWAEVTLPATGWTLSGTVYVQTVACAAAAATMKGYPNVGLKKSTDTAAAALEKEAFALIETVDTADGSITATCGDTAPQVAITLLFAGGVA